MGVETWTEPMVADLKRLLGAGLSAGQIAVELNAGLTRNAVIGKVKRMGLSFLRAHGARTAAVSTAPKPQRMPRPAPPRVSFAGSAAEVVTAALLPSEPVADGAGILDVMVALQSGDCRWPVGDPRLPGFRYCCAPRADGKPYCAAHAEAAIDPNRKA